MPDTTAWFTKRLNTADWALSKLAPYGLAGKRLLDLGCGSGAVLLKALEMGAHEVVGVDLDPFGSGLVSGDVAAARAERKALFRSYVVERGLDRSRVVFVTGDIGRVDLGAHHGMDFVTGVGLIDHVADPEAVMRTAFAALRPGGICFMGTGPLFYAPDGHHLFHAFPASEAPWAHLRPDFLARLGEKELGQTRLHEFNSLNRITVARQRAIYCRAGFRIREMRLRQVDAALFERAGEHIDLSLVPSRADLFVTTSRFLLERPRHPGRIALQRFVGRFTRVPRARRPLPLICGVPQSRVL